jgi:hypothetical protein
VPDVQLMGIQINAFKSISSKSNEVGPYFRFMKLLAENSVFYTGKG